MKKNILVVAAHPDDELLGCAGTILKHKEAGDNVYICIVTVADDRWGSEYKNKKLKEAILLDNLLNINKRYYCKLPTTSLNSLPSHILNDAIKKVFDEVLPDIVYTHFEHDVNEDHQRIFKSVLVNARPIKNLTSIRCFETLSSTEWGSKAFNSNFYVILSKQHIVKKIRAFNYYESEVKKYPHPRSPEGIEILAKKRGNDICKKYAESFIIIKEYWE